MFQRLIVDTHVLVGGEEIQQSLTDLIEGYLGQGGMDWPDISGLKEAISQAAEASASAAATPKQAGTLQTPLAPATVSSASPSPDNISGPHAPGNGNIYLAGAFRPRPSW